MERVQRVNGGQDTLHPVGTVRLAAPEFGGSEEPAGRTPRVPGRAEASYGTCLYFGPRGERCSREALASGFCAQHAPKLLSPTAPTRSSPAISKEDFEARQKRFVRVVVAILGFAAVLWPIIADAIRALLAFLKDH